MSIELTIRPRLQTTPYSCWWFAMAMILDYYGRHYPDPNPLGPGLSGHDSWLRPYGPLPGRVYPSPADLDSWTHGGAAPQAVDSEQWFQHGIPNTAAGLRQFRNLSGFHGIPNSLPISQWTTAHVEDLLRTYGPILFIGQWSGFPHAIVVCGVSPEGLVTYADPNGAGFNVYALEAFKRLAGRFPAYECESLNPLYYPSPPQVRAFRVNITDTPVTAAP